MAFLLSSVRAGDQHLLVEAEDSGHRVDPGLLLQDQGGHRALVELPLRFDVRHLAAKDLLGADAGGPGVGAVDEEDPALSRQQGERSSTSLSASGQGAP